MRFYLGTHKPQHLERTAVPLFLSRRVLAGRRSYPRALGPWALDSGGYTELGTYGEWRLSAAAYGAEVRRYAAEVGRLEWAACRDYLAVPEVLERAGLTVDDAHRLTVRNYLDDREELGELVRPVLQGWAPEDYVRHADAYADAGVDLEGGVVLVGSIAARDGTPAAEQTVRRLAGLGLELHGLGAKEGGLARYADALSSADSLAWSRYARTRRTPMPGHRHGKAGAGHCGNCLEAGLEWREGILKLLAGGSVEALELELG